MREEGIPALRPGDPPPAGRLRRARLQPALRAALHQRADHARPGRHPAARRADRTDHAADHRRRLRLPQPGADARLLRRLRHRRRRRGDHRDRPHLDRRPPRGPEPRPRLCAALARIAGVYVPSLYEVSLQTTTVPSPDYACNASRMHAARFIKRIVPTLPPPPTKFIVPFIDIVHNRAAIEIQRGCTRGCRFCQAGMIFRPVRERPRGRGAGRGGRDDARHRLRGGQLSLAQLLRLQPRSTSWCGEVAARHGDEKLSHRPAQPAHRERSAST